MKDKNTTSIYNENIVQEIMGLVETYGEVCESYGGNRTIDAYSTSTEYHSKIESKLRELVENKSSVQKPLSDDEIDALWVFCGDLSVPQKVQRRMIVRTTEAAHGITK
jgi:hypothetical protein